MSLTNFSTSVDQTIRTLGGDVTLIKVTSTNYDPQNPNFVNTENSYSFKGVVTKRKITEFNKNIVPGGDVMIHLSTSGTTVYPKIEDIIEIATDDHNFTRYRILDVQPKQFQNTVICYACICKRENWT